MGNLIPFDLEKFKAGQKALTRNGRVATFVGVCEDCEDSYKLIVHLCSDYETISYFLDGYFYKYIEDMYDLVSMVSRHQALIDSYDPEDTWQWSRIGENDWAAVVTPSWDEKLDYRLHPHNDLIKAHKNGAKVESYICGEWIEEPAIDWYEDTQYRIKSEPKTKTKTVYEWIHEANVGNVNYFVSLWVADEDIEHLFGLDTPKQKYKTGRSWETGV